MEYRKLGRCGLRVSPICLGTMMFGGRASATTAARIVGTARDSGVNFIDTADVYGQGEAEKITGKLIRRDRDHWVLASKVGYDMGDRVNRRGLGRKWIMQAIEGSLKRLATDYLDLYYLHLDDPETPLEETLGVMADLIHEGKIRYWGFSNFRGWRVAQMAALCDKLGIPRPVAGQPYYNAMNRMPEVDYLPACQAFGIGAVPYSPLARGVLTGKYDPAKEPPRGTRAGDGDRRILNSEWRKESLVMAQKIRKHAEQRGMKPGHFAINWVLNNAIVSSVIAGPRTLGQWRDYLGALKHGFTAEDEALIDAMVATGHPSTPGYNDPLYPITGRAAKTGGTGEGP